MRKTAKTRQNQEDMVPKNVVPIDAGKAAEVRVGLIKQFVAEAENLRNEGKAINERRKALFDYVAANGIDRAAFKDALKKLRLETEQREKYEFSARELARAFGFDDGSQVEMFATDLGDQEPRETGIASSIASEILRAWEEDEETAET